MIVLAGIAVASTAAQAQFLGTRWATGGPGKAVVAPPYGNGEFSWSIADMGIGIAPIVGDVDHGGLASMKFDDLLPGDALRRPKAIFESALKVWTDAAGAILKNLGEKADGGGVFGGDDHDKSGVGDIRVGVFRWTTPPNHQFDVLAHAWKPDTKALNSHAGYGTIGGDIHIRPHKNFDAQNGEVWVDDPDAGVDKIDLETLFIHEIGHALGLDHSDAEDSVMGPVYTKPRRTLGAGDKANIKKLYTVVPEPVSLAALGMGLALVLVRRKR